MSERNALSELVRRGRVRQVRHLLFHQASFAASLGLGGAILLLILGTQILNWYWPVLLFAGCLAVGAYRSRNKISSRYQVAQSIDRELGFHDSLSTAIFFAERPDHAEVSREFIDEQRKAAENLARSADVERGLPFLRRGHFTSTLRWPRSSCRCSECDTESTTISICGRRWCASGSMDS